MWWRSDGAGGAKGGDQGECGPAKHVAGLALTDLLAGQVQVGFPSLPSAIGQT
jgi:hypothetical protein